MRNRFLSVVANPYNAIDPDGDPCGVSYRVDVRADPIGASVDLEGSKRGRVKFRFSREPVSVTDRAEHRRLVASGQLFAADTSTASRCGVFFEEPAVLLERARERAALAYLAAKGEFPTFVDNPKAGPSGEVIKNA